MPTSKNEAATTEYAAKALVLQFDATVAEYKDLRTTAMARDAYRNSLLNYIFVFIAAAIAGLPTLVPLKAYFAYLIVSIVISGLSLLHSYNSRLNTYFILFEHEILRKRMQSIIKEMAKRGGLILEPKVLEWQKYYRELTTKRWKSEGWSNMLAFGLTGTLPLLAAAGAIYAFCATTRYQVLSPYEPALYWLAVCFFAAAFIFAVQTALNGREMWATLDKP